MTISLRVFFFFFYLLVITYYDLFFFFLKINNVGNIEIRCDSIYEGYINKFLLIRICLIIYRV